MQKINENKTITIYDIAKEAGVSPSTVSRVLTNNANVRKEKKEKVLALIEKYNFKPNVLARGLADTKTRTIGILAADVRNPYYASLYVACEKAAKEAGYTVILCNFLSDPMEERRLLEVLENQKVDAIIQFGGRVDDLVTSEEYIDIINVLQEKIPVVITGKLDGTRCHAVRIDAMKAMDLILEHLILLGHEQIAMVGGSNTVLSTFEKRQRYKQIMKSHGFDYDPELIDGEGDYNYDTGYNVMSRMLDEGKKPTAVVAINDFTAIGVMRCIKERGLRIPEDIALVSYDNTYMTEMVYPKITSIDYNYEEYGKSLVSAAVRLIRGEEVETLKMVTPTLVVRESSLKK